MKGLTTILLLSLGNFVAAQQTTAPVVSLAGIGSIKLGMKKAELDKLLAKPVTLKNLLRKDWERDTIQVNHSGIDYELILDKSVEEKDNGAIIIYVVYSRNPLLKTKSGIAIGDDKIKIVITYPDYMLHIAPEYNPVDGTKIKGRGTVSLYSDDTPAMIVFMLEEGKVTGFYVQYSEGC